MAKKKGKVHIGTSGYQYDHWRGPFYPKDIPKKSWFDFYSDQFESVEINNTFYNLPKAETFDKWGADAPRGFYFALKFSRYGTHQKKLKDPEEPIDRFLARAEGLGKHLGPVLVQLPPNWHPNYERLDEFLSKAGARAEWTVEVRDPEWLGEELYAILREHDAALCIHDMIGDHPEVITTSWTYFRFHGNHYRGSYSPQKLSAIADRIDALRDRGIGVFVYFNNDEAGYAAKNAQQLKDYLSRRE